MPVASTRDDANNAATTTTAPLRLQEEEEQEEAQTNLVAAPNADHLVTTLQDWYARFASTEPQPAMMDQVFQGLLGVVEVFQCNCY